MYTIEQIFNQTYTQVLNHCKRVIKNQHDAEDVASDVFVKIQKLMSKDSTRFNEEKSALTTWVHTVTNSVILDFFKTNHQDKYKAVSDFVDNDSSKNENKVYFNFVASERHNADRKVLDAELQSRVAKAFRSLKPKYRKIAVLFFLRDLPYTEIAEIVNVPMGTVKGMISRARTKLQAELDGAYNLRAVNVQKAEA